MLTSNGRPHTARSIGRRQEDHTRARLAALVHSSAVAIIGETLDGIIIDWNPAAERLYGYSAAEVMGQHRTILLPPAEAAAVDAMVARLHRGESITGLETVRWTRDGRRLDVALTISPVWNDAGELIATSAIVRDITARKATETALAASVALFRVAFANAPIGMVLAGLDLRMLQVNHALCDMLGYTEEELSGTDFWACSHPDDVAPNRALMERALAGEIDRYELEKRYRHNDGHLVWGHLSGSLVRGDAGAPLYFISQIQDITQRKAADDILAASEERFRVAFADAPVGMAIVRPDGVVLRLNRTGCQILGYAEEELVGTTLLTLTHPDDREENADLIARALAGESRTFAMEKRYLHKDGQIVWAALSASLVRDGDGSPRYFLSQFQDITARKHADAALRDALDAAHAATRAKSLFLAMMSHELRTPLQAVLGYADFLLADPEGSFRPEQVEDIRAISRGAERMVALIEQMLDLSRMEAGRLQVERKPVDLMEILEHVRQDITPQVTAKGLALTIDLPESLPPVLGDAVRLRQILLNLVGNAVKFTEAGAVDITASQTADGITVKVRDTGIGISQEALPFIFEEFRQVDGSLTRRHGGAGLGLAIAKRLAEQMGGDISVESALGAGSTFTLWLPVAPRMPPPSHRRRDSSPGTPRGERRGPGN